MTVTICKERPQARTAIERKDGHRQYGRVFYVETSSKYDDAIKVLMAPGLPSLFSIYDVGTAMDIGARCIGRDTAQIGPTQWEVSLTYDSDPGDPTDPTSPDNPQYPDNQEDDPDKWYENVAVTFSAVDEVISNGQTRNAYDPYIAGADPTNRTITNSAGEPYDPPPTQMVYYPVLTFTIYRKVFDKALALKYVGAKNADIFWGGTPRQWRIVKYDTGGIEYKKVGNSDVWYYKIDIECEFKEDTWDLKLLDYGSYWVSGTAPNLIRHSFLTKDGQPYTGLLNENGGKLADNEEVHYRTYSLGSVLPFAVLNLPATMPTKPNLIRTL